MSGPTGWGKRSRYRPDPGVEIDKDNELFDVVEWRREFVPSSHYRIHQGQAYSTHLNNSNLPLDSEINLAMQTGEKSVHIIFDVSGKFDYDFDVFEEPTFTGGASQPSYNRNRVSSSISTATLLNGVNITDNGLNISRDVVSGGQKIGGNLAFGNEWVLNPSTSYVFKLTSRANSNRVHLNLFWYEPS